MPQWDLPWEGQCRCGEIRIKVTAPPLITAACHCTGCQRMSSSAYSLSAAIPSEGFSVIAGEPVIGGLHGETKHYFCPACMTWMFTRPEGIDWIVNLRPTMLDDASWFTPFVEMFTGEGLPWAKTPAIHSYEKAPTFDDFGRLVKEYAERAG